MGRVTESKYSVQASWDDVPHLGAAAKKDLYESTPPYLRDARAKGIPSLGAGAIYPIPLEDVICQPFEIPAYWRRGYGLDVGWNRTAAVWGAEDPTDKTLFLYAEHYMGQAIPAVHVTAIKARGEWINGAIDPAARGRAVEEGRQLLSTYTVHGLKLVPALNAVEPGLYECWNRLQTGRLRIFKTLGNLHSEYRLYRRDENGKVVKENDHLMDAMRYLVMTWNGIAKVKPAGAEQSGGTTMVDETSGY